MAERVRMARVLNPQDCVLTMAQESLRAGSSVAQRPPASQPSFQQPLAAQQRRSGPPHSSVEAIAGQMAREPTRDELIEIPAGSAVIRNSGGCGASDDACLTPGMAWVRDFETRQCHPPASSKDPEGQLASEVAELREVLAEQVAQLECRLQERFTELHREVDLLDRRHKELSSTVVHSEALVLEHSRKMEATMLGHLEALRRDQRAELKLAVGRAVEARFQAMQDQGLAISEELAQAAQEVSDLANTLSGATEEHSKLIQQLQTSQEALASAVADMAEQHQRAQQDLTSATAKGLGTLRAEMQEMGARLAELERTPLEVYFSPRCGEQMRSQGVDLRPHALKPPAIDLSDVVLPATSVLRKLPETGEGMDALVGTTPRGYPLSECGDPIVSFGASAQNPLSNSKPLSQDSPELIVSPRKRLLS